MPHTPATPYLQHLESNAHHLENCLNAWQAMKPEMAMQIRRLPYVVALKSITERFIDDLKKTEFPSLQLLATLAHGRNLVLPKSQGKAPIMVPNPDLSLSEEDPAEQGVVNLNTQIAHAFLMASPVSTEGFAGFQHENIQLGVEHDDDPNTMKFAVRDMYLGRGHVPNLPFLKVNGNRAIIDLWRPSLRLQNTPLRMICEKKFTRLSSEIFQEHTGEFYDFVNDRFKGRGASRTIDSRTELTLSAVSGEISHTYGPFRYTGQGSLAMQSRDGSDKLCIEEGTFTPDPHQKIIGQGTASYVTNSPHSLAEIEMKGTLTFDNQNLQPRSPRVLSSAASEALDSLLLASPDVALSGPGEVTVRITATADSSAENESINHMKGHWVTQGADNRLLVDENEFQLPKRGWRVHQQTDRHHLLNGNPCHMITEDRFLTDEPDKVLQRTKIWLVPNPQQILRVVRTFFHRNGQLVMQQSGRQVTFIHHISHALVGPVTSRAVITAGDLCGYTVEKDHIARINNTTRVVRQHGPTQIRVYDPQGNKIAEIRPNSSMGWDGELPASLPGTLLIFRGNSQPRAIPMYLRRSSDQISLDVESALNACAQHLNTRNNAQDSSNKRQRLS